MKVAHFIGIGGIGMSALAQLLAHEGARVTGSDRAESPVTELLGQKGIAVVFPQQAENVPEDAECVIYSDAVPRDNPERVRARELGIPEYSYFQMLGKVSSQKKTIAVAGTHGKTTTTGMLGKLLIDAGVAPTVVVGSLMKDFGSNYVPGTSEQFVVEACEYKDHLLELSPEVLVITNLEWDHTDYFPSLAAVQESFRKAVAKVPAEGAIVTNPADPNIAPVLEAAQARVIDYTQETVVPLRVPGAFNELNACAAIAAARVVAPNLSNEEAATALAEFHGTWRRFEYKGKTARGVDVYDDYAHHPSAIAATLDALRAQTAGKLFVAFHPHLFSRTKDLFEDFAGALAKADDVSIAPIYAAREVDDGSVSSAQLAQRVQELGATARASTFEEIEAYLAATPGDDDVIMTMGAGDIYKVADALIQ